jgi:hypothetical protein
VFGAQVGFDNRLPPRPRGRLFRDPNHVLGYFPESFAQRFYEQLILAPEMLVKASVRQAGVLHNGCNRGASQAFGANAPRAIFHNSVMNLDFMFGPVAHVSL